jgi:oligopeptidase A
VQWAKTGEPIRLPCAHMVCNQTPPIGDSPSLMTFREVETLFHEFGHALQHMLTREQEGLVSGIRGVEWDAVELPSQFMENWCYDYPTLMSFAKHYESGEPLPRDLFDKLKAARYACSGFFAPVAPRVHGGASYGHPVHSFLCLHCFRSSRMLTITGKMPF